MPAPVPDPRHPLCEPVSGRLARIPDLGRVDAGIGSHGLDHLSLGKLPSDDVWRQVFDSRRMLEDRLGLRVDTLAYPYGTLRDFNEHVKLQVARAGYRAACTSVNGVNRRGTDWFELRRTKIEQADDRVFRHVVEGHLDGWYFIDRYLGVLQNRYEEDVPEPDPGPPEGSQGGARSSGLHRRECRPDMPTGKG
jgi:hypothetical protein